MNPFFARFRWILPVFVLMGLSPVLAEDGFHPATFSTATPSGVVSETSIQPAVDLFTPNYLVWSLDGGHVTYWDLTRNPIRVYISPGKGIRAYRPEFRDWVMQGLSTWEGAMGGALRFVPVDSPQKADLEIDWTDRTIPSHVAEYANATCERHIRGEGKIFHAVVTLGTLEPYTQKPFNAQQIKHLVIHEMGHALGLNHSPDPADVMYSGLSESPTQAPSVRDVNTLRLIYRQVQASVVQHLGALNSLPSQ